MERPTKRTFYLYTLGSVRLIVESTGVALDGLVRNTRATALLSFLLVSRPQGPQHRDRIATLLWPELSQANARHALRQAAYLLRHNLGGETVESVGMHHLALRPNSVRCDVLEFEDAIRSSDWPRANKLYRGDFLVGFVAPGCPDFDNWVGSRRIELARMGRLVWCAMADLAVQNDDLRAAVAFTQRCVDSDPYDEETVRSLIRLHVRAGDRAAAVSAYHRLAERLRRDLQVPPSEETQGLIRNVQDGGSESQEISVIATAVASRDGARGHYSVVPRSPRYWYRRVIAAAFAGVTLFVFGSRQAPQPELETTAIAVLPFIVHDSTRSLLREGLMDLVSIRLNTIPGYGAIDARHVLGSVSSADSVLSSGALRRIVRQVRADHLITGRLIPDRSGIRVVAQLFSTDGSLTLLEEADQPGSDTDLPSLVDGLVAQLLTNSQTPPARRAGVAAAATSRDPNALRHFLEAEQRLRSDPRSLLMEDRYARANEAYLRAFELDPTFALAAYKLARTRSLRGDHSGAAAWSDTALTRSASLPRHYRLLIQGRHAYDNGLFADAEWYFRSILTDRPRELDALEGLAETVLHGRPLRGLSLAGVDTLFERVIEADPNHNEGLVHLAHLRHESGDFESGAELGKRAHAGEGAVPHTILPALARDSGLDVEAWARGSLPVVTFLSSWTVGMHLADLDASRSLLDLATQSGLAGPWIEDASVMRAYFDAAGGRYASAIDHLQSGLITGDRAEIAAWLVTLSWLTDASGDADVDNLLIGLSTPDQYRSVQWGRWHAAARDVVRRYLRAGLLLYASRPREADSIIRSLSGQQSEDHELDSLARDLSRTLSARDTWLRQGRTSEALAILDSIYGLTTITKSGSPFYSRSDARLMRAEINRELHRFDEARRWYESLESVDPPYLVYRAFVDHRLAEIYRERGEDSLALRRYERLLKQWTNPAPKLLPMRDTVFVRLEELRSSH